MTRIRTFVAASLALLVLAQPAPAMASASKDELLGMFAGNRPTRTQTLSEPHRSLKEMGNWASNQTAVALQLLPGQGTATLSKNRALFTPAGYAAYMAFLNGLPFAKALQADKLELTSIVDSQPLLIGQGSSNGRYVWIFELPVLITATDATTPGTAARTKDVTLRIQIGRSAAAKNEAGVLIENWGEYIEGQPAKKPATPGTPAAPATGTPASPATKTGQ